MNDLTTLENLFKGLITTIGFKDYRHYIERPHDKPDSAIGVIEIEMDIIQKKGIDPKNIMLAIADKIMNSEIARSLEYPLSQKITELEKTNAAQLIVIKNLTRYRHYHELEKELRGAGK